MNGSLNRIPILDVGDFIQQAVERILHFVLGDYLRDKTHKAVLIVNQFASQIGD